MKNLIIQSLETKGVLGQIRVNIITFTMDIIKQYNFPMLIYVDLVIISPIM